MRSLKRFIHLPRRRQSLLLRALFATLIVRLALRWLSLQTIQRVAKGAGRRVPESFTSHEIIWASQAAARLIPGSKCLVRALALKALLECYGYMPRVTIGVRKEQSTRFSAHAWVTCDGEVLIGDSEGANYTALLNLES
jgi:transglutaminase superfamily protein